MPVQTEFTLSVDEFLEGQRVYVRFLAPRLTRFNYRCFAPLGVVLIALGIVDLALRLSIGRSLFVIALGGYLISCKTIIWPRKMRKEFAQYPDEYWKQKWQLGEDKISVQTSHANSEMDWTRFNRFIETSHLFVLFVPPRFFHVIPKRSFPPEAVDELRALARYKVKDVVQLA